MRSNEKEGNDGTGEEMCVEGEAVWKGGGEERLGVWRVERGVGLNAVVWRGEEREIHGKSITCYEILDSI